jgi:uncharacterized repeat protein (TIGR03803 family)
MRNGFFARFGPIARQWLIVALLSTCFAVFAYAGEKTIFQFNQTQGAFPESSLTSDANGNLYGTTSLGGAFGWGTVFELSPGSGGTWNETVLFSFQDSKTTGITPWGALTMDSSGNLFGVAFSFTGDGLLFELSKGANGTWTETVLHKFSYQEGTPFGDLVFDSAGNFYGTTENNYLNSNGEVFEFVRQSDGTYREKLLCSFPVADGVSAPAGGLTFDSHGNLYGPAALGLNGTLNGAVYELSPQSNGTWTFSLVYSFKNNGVFDLNSRVVFDANGNLYGTTYDNNNGQVYQLRHEQGGGWKETVLHSFNKTGGDGRWPVGDPVFDNNGNLYGVTFHGGYGCNQALCGVIYKLAPQSDGTWKETVVHAFESALDGSQPRAGMILSNSGNLYGSTYYGGNQNGNGTVYQITP